MPSTYLGSVFPIELEGTIPLMGLPDLFGGCGVVAVFALLADGLPKEFCRAAIAQAVAVEMGPLTVPLAPSPKPTKLARARSPIALILAHLVHVIADASIGLRGPATLSKVGFVLSLLLQDAKHRDPDVGVFLLIVSML